MKKISSLVIAWMLLTWANNVLANANTTISIDENWTKVYENNMICSIWTDLWWLFNDSNIKLDSQMIQWAWSFILNAISLDFDNSWKTIKEWDYFDLKLDEKVLLTWATKESKLRDVLDWNWKIILESHYNINSKTIKYIFTKEIENLNDFKANIQLLTTINNETLSKHWSHSFETKIWEKTLTNVHEVNLNDFKWQLKESNFISTQSILSNKDLDSWKSTSIYLFEAKAGWNLADWLEKMYFEYITENYTEWNKEPNQLSNFKFKVFKLKDWVDTSNFQYNENDFEREVTNEIIEVEWKINWQKAYESEFTLIKWDKYVIILENDSKVVETTNGKSVDILVWLHLTTKYKQWWIIVQPPFNWEPEIIVPVEPVPEPWLWDWDFFPIEVIPPVEIWNWEFVVDENNKVTQILSLNFELNNVNLGKSTEWKDKNNCSYWKKVSILKQDDQWNVLSDVNFSIKKDKEYLKDSNWEKMIFSTWRSWKFIFETEIWSSYEFFEEQFDWIEKYDIVPWAFVKSLDIRMNSKNWEEYKIVNKLKPKEEPKEPEKPIEENPVIPDLPKEPDNPITVEPVEPPKEEPVKPEEPKKPEQPSNPSWPGWYSPNHNSNKIPNDPRVTTWSEVPVTPKENEEPKIEEKLVPPETTEEKPKFIFDPVEPIPANEVETSVKKDETKYKIKLPKTWWEITQEQINKKVWKKSNKSLELNLIKWDFKKAWSKNTDLDFWLEQLSKNEKNNDEFLVIPSEWLVMPIWKANENLNETKLWALMTKFATKFDYMTQEWSSVYWEKWTKFIWWHSSYFKWKQYWKYKTHFQKIIWLEKNEEIWVYKKNKEWKFDRYVYQVNQSYNSKWENITVEVDWKDNLVLFTCTPIWWNSWRWIVNSTLKQ